MTTRTKNSLAKDMASKYQAPKLTYMIRKDASTIRSLVIYIWLSRTSEGQSQEGELLEEQLQKQVQEKYHGNMGWTW